LEEGDGLGEMLWREMRGLGMVMGLGRAMGLVREMGLRTDMGWEREMGCMRKMADDALWEGHTLLKTGLSAHRHRHTQTERQTDRHIIVKTVYPPVSLHSLGGL